MGSPKLAPSLTLSTVSTSRGAQNLTFRSRPVACRPRRFHSNLSASFQLSCPFTLIHRRTRTDRKIPAYIRDPAHSALIYVSRGDVRLVAALQSYIITPCTAPTAEHWFLSTLSAWVVRPTALDCKAIYTVYLHIDDAVNLRIWLVFYQLIVSLQRSSLLHQFRMLCC